MINVELMTNGCIFLSLTKMICYIMWTDPFADANAENSGAGTKEYVHIRIQQRNGRKSLTTVQGLKKEFSYNKILKDLKKEFCCNGTVVQDPELGQVNILCMMICFFCVFLFTFAILHWFFAYCFLIFVRLK